MGLDDFGDLERDEPEYPQEEVVEEIVVDYFQDNNFDSVQTSDNHGGEIPDVVAVGDSLVWGVEVKGDSSNNKERVYAALGQIIYEMEHGEIQREDRRWAIAFPETIDSREQYRERIDQNVSLQILKMLNIYVMFVGRNGNVDILEPGEIGAE
jgi:Holliday junction resolvase